MMAMAKRAVEFSEWRPDIALLDTKFAAEVNNVFAGANSYLPFPDLRAYSSATLPAPACGLYSARNTSGIWRVYAGTATALFVYNLGAWVDISRTVGGAYNVPSGDLWQFEQSGNHVVAVNANNEPQWVNVDLTLDTFEDLPGSPPKATNVKQIGDFLVLSGLPSNNRTIMWSAINDITGWTIGLNLCDMQEFPDCGPVQGVAGAEIGYVIQERGIRSLQFLPGDTTYIFNITRVLHDRGSVSKYGFNSIGNVLYFVSEDGFYSITGQQVTPIGSDKVNDWFLAHSDIGRRNVVQCIPNINKPRVAWTFHAVSGSPMYDQQIIFDWSNGRWSRASISARVWALLGSIGIDLDTDDAGDLPDDIDLDSASRPLDSFAYIGGRPLIGAIDDEGHLSVLNGPNLAATMETAEVHLSPGFRTFVSEAYPLDDSSATGTVAAGTRERLQDLVVWEAPVGIEITGSGALYSSSRLHRFRRSLPAGSTWTHAQGVVIEAQPDGSVA